MCVWKDYEKKKIFFSLLSQWWRLLLLFKFFVRRLEKKKICHPILILESDPTKKELFSSDIPHLSTWNGIFHHWDDQWWYFSIGWLKFEKPIEMSNCTLQGQKIIYENSYIENEKVCYDFKEILSFSSKRIIFLDQTRFLFFTLSKLQSILTIEARWLKSL